MTLTIDDDLAGLLRKRARELGLPFRTVVNAMPRNGLGEAAKPRHRAAPKTIPHPFGFRPGIDLDKLNQLADELTPEVCERLACLSLQDGRQYSMRERCSMAELRTSPAPMSAEAFIAWYDRQPEGARYELLDGQIHEMAAERLVHARTKARVLAELTRQIAAARLPCEALPDGVAVRVDDETVFEPDALVRCGPALPDDTIVILDPIIVLEVVSPSSQRIDALVKFTRYFRNPSIVHYLIVVPDKRVIIHHRRSADGRIVSASHEEGILRLEPPGLDLPLTKLLSEPSEVADG